MKIQLPTDISYFRQPKWSTTFLFFSFFLVHFIFYEETAKKGKEKKSRFFKNCINFWARDSYEDKLEVPKRLCFFKMFFRTCVNDLK